MRRRKKKVKKMSSADSRAIMGLMGRKGVEGFPLVRMSPGRGKKSQRKQEKRGPKRRGRLEERQSLDKERGAGPSWEAHSNCSPSAGAAQVGVEAGRGTPLGASCSG